MTELKKNIVWLASYPKSGNTWFRAFLAALTNETADLNLNELNISSQFINQDLLDFYLETDTGLLAQKEWLPFVGEVYNQHSQRFSRNWYLKSHHPFYPLDAKNPTFPNEATQCALIFVRNPLDVCVSFKYFSNHDSFEKSIAIMNEENGAKWHNSAGNLNIPNWSDFNQSWRLATDFPVHFVRYEDMLADTFQVFSTIVHDYLKLSFSVAEIEKAIAETAFEKLKEKEKATGFKENPHGNTGFFRSGKAGNWKEELSAQQVKRLIDFHHQEMEKFGYL